MRSPRPLFLLAAFIAPASGCTSPNDPPPQPALITLITPKPGDTILFVDGLTCPFCTYNVERQVRKVQGVQDVNVDLASGRVVVTPSAGARIAEADLRQAVKDSGFTVRTFEKP